MYISITGLKTKNFLNSNLNFFLFVVSSLRIKSYVEIIASPELNIILPLISFNTDSSSLNLFSYSLPFTTISGFKERIIFCILLFPF